MANASASTTLQGELKLIHCLIDLMKQEQQFLVAADTDGLTTLTPLKNDLIEQMAQLAGQRHQNLAADGFEASETGMEAWLDSINDSDAAALWQALLATTAEAKEMNRVNGMLINKQLAHNQILINAMRAPAGAADNNFYGPSGQTTTVTSKRRLVIG